MANPWRNIGDVQIRDLAVYKVQMERFTTAPTTGLTKGDLVMLFHGSTPKLGICTSTAAQTLKFRSFRTKTFGRLTA